MPAQEPAVIHLDGLSVELGGRPILKSLDARLTGRAIGLLGPNGAGKTTLIHTLLGFHKPSAGTATVLGQDIGASTSALREQLGYMPESDAHIPGMSAVRFVRLMAELSGLPPDVALERAHESLYFVGLGEARYREVQTFSLGMKQKVKLAQALVHGPRLIFLDEPTNGLDPRARQRMIELIREIADTGLAQILLSSHLLRDVEQCCQEVLVLKDGRIAVHCDLEAERQNNRSFLDLELGGDVAALTEALTAIGGELAQHGQRRLKMVAPEGFSIGQLYALAEQHGAQIRRLSYKQDSLEDIFLEAMEERTDERTEEWTDERMEEVVDGGL
jgi:ABC-2 type transport system ATP-binding protein